MKGALPITLYIIIASVSITLIADGLVDSLRPYIQPVGFIGIGLILFGIFAMFLTAKYSNMKYLIIIALGIVLSIIGFGFN